MICMTRAQAFEALGAYHANHAYPIDQVDDRSQIDLVAGDEMSSALL